MDLTQLFVFCIMPVIIALYALFSSKKLKIELFILPYVFAHASSGITIFDFSFSFEKIMCIFLVIMTFTKYKMKFSEVNTMLSIWLFFLIYSCLNTIFNEKYTGLILTFFDFLQIIILPLFLFNYLKHNPISIFRLTLGFYRIGVLIFLIQLVEIYFQQDFYHLINFSDGFNNYIGSIERNNLMRASSLFSEVSITSLYSLMGLLLSMHFFERIMKLKAILLFLAIIYLSSTRLGVGLALVLIIFNLLKLHKIKLKYLIGFSIFMLLLLVTNLDAILENISSITRTGTENSFTDSNKDSSLYQRDLQFNFLIEFSNSSKIIFGLGRSRVLDFIDNLNGINTLDSKIIMQILFNGIIGLIIYLIGIKKLVFFNIKNNSKKIFQFANNYFLLSFLS